MKVKIIKKGSQPQAAKLESTRNEIFDKEAQRQATHIVQSWVYATQARKRDEELRCREFWKLH